MKGLSKLYKYNSAIQLATFHCSGMYKFGKSSFIEVLTSNAGCKSSCFSKY